MKTEAGAVIGASLPAGSFSSGDSKRVISKWTRKESYGKVKNHVSFRAFFACPIVKVPVATIVDIFYFFYSLLYFQEKASTFPNRVVHGTSKCNQ